MASYLVLPYTALDWNDDRPEKVRVNDHRYGIYDLLREFESEPFPFTRATALCLTGIDELLIQLEVIDPADHDREWPVLREIHRRLVAAAHEVSNLGVIQVPIRYPMELLSDQRLVVNYTGRRVPLWRIFGTHPDVDKVTGHAAYSYGVNLS